MGAFANTEEEKNRWEGDGTGKRSLRNFFEDRRLEEGIKPIYKPPQRRPEHLQKVSCQSAQRLGRDVSTGGHYAH